MREKVEEVSVDMWGGFPRVVEEVFPNASVVFDRFHVMKPVNEELNKIRKQVKVTDKGSKFIKKGIGVMSEGRRICPSGATHDPSGRPKGAKGLRPQPNAMILVAPFQEGSESHKRKVPSAL